MNEPRIVTPQEAQSPGAWVWASDLLYTVATEPERFLRSLEAAGVGEADRTRAAVVKALRDAAEVDGMPEEVQAFATRADRFEVARYLSEQADAIENGADY